MSFVKGLLPGLLLTFIVATIVGSNGSTGDFLNIHRAVVSGHHFYWSWPLFIASTGLASGLFWMMD